MADLPSSCNTLGFKSPSYVHWFCDLGQVVVVVVVNIPSAEGMVILSLRIKCLDAKYLEDCMADENPSTSGDCYCYFYANEADETC